MAHPQSSPRGYIAHTRIDVGSNQITGNSTALLLSGGLALSDRSTSGLTENSTGLVLAGGIKISNVVTLTSDSTALAVPDAPSALPGDWSTGFIQFGSNSTGNWAAVNVAGTTWKYLNVTTVLPT